MEKNFGKVDEFGGPRHGFLSLQKQNIGMNPVAFAGCARMVRLA
jgi:hypothetical protein